MHTGMDTHSHSSANHLGHLALVTRAETGLRRWQDLADWVDVLLDDVEILSEHKSANSLKR